MFSNPNETGFGSGAIPMANPTYNGERCSFPCGCHLHGVGLFLPMPMTQPAAGHLCCYDDPKAAGMDKLTHSFHAWDLQ
ncbi:hypothetical protein CK203_087604 [Vitis vinifera]|uniref:Uncharacterized protein n=1 Tax=Vitis vinifera TaxID=29760 RepID=A0A438EZS2_VITVI|nr:hypothetical protein CK203_087604 [Vitis vinifera]